MTEQARIDHLKTTVPTVRLTAWQRVARIFGWVCSFVAIAALTLSVYATRQATQVSTCVNDVLAERAAPTANDNQAHIDFAKALDALIVAKPATPAERVAVVAAFKTAAAAYELVLVNDQDFRQAHPLGRC